MKGGLSIFPSGQNLFAGALKKEATSQQCAHYTVLQERIKNVHFTDGTRVAASSRTFALAGRLRLFATLLPSRTKEYEWV